MMQPDYIGSDYYGWNYANLVIAHNNGVTASPNRVTYEVGNLVIVAARNDDRQVYGFIGTVTEVLESKTSGDYWPTSGSGSNDYPVNKITVHSPITVIPANLYSQMTQGGIKLDERKGIAEYLRDSSELMTPLPTDTQETVPVLKPQLKKEDLRIGYVYILQNLLGDGYKIGVTDNIHRRFKQLEVGSKAACVGYWSSDNYNNLERFLHTQLSPKRVPQSEWFILTEDELNWALEWLNDNSTCIDLNVQDEALEERESPTLFRRMRNFIVGSPTV